MTYNDTPNHDYIETEIKFYVPDLQQIEANLIQVGAVCTKPRILEKNVRYDLPDQQLTNARRVLRLRQDTQIRLSYKEPLERFPAEAFLSRVEVETVVNDFDAMDSILRHLGYVPYMTYEKYRTTYELAGGEIVLDEMPYGNFVEVEGKADQIKQIIHQAGLSNAHHVDAGYVALFRMVKAKLHLTFTDLTFSNFADIVVPPSLFTEL